MLKQYQNRSGPIVLWTLDFIWCNLLMLSRSDFHYTCILFISINGAGFCCVVIIISIILFFDLLIYFFIFFFWLVFLKFVLGWVFFFYFYHTIKTTSVL